jgi:hypothetical protein
MPVLPKSRVAKIEWAEERTTLWNTNSVAMGSSAPTVTAWQALVADARAKYQARNETQNAAIAATNEYNMAIDAMVNATADIIKQVKTKAALDGNDTAYSLANIPVPAIASPVGPPGTATDFKVKVEGDGTLVLTWKCPQPPGAVGTTYNVFRRTTPSGPFDFLGTSGQRKFIDATLPANSVQITYQIQAIRSTALGANAQFLVNFGVGSGGIATASVTPVKLAA